MREADLLLHVVDCAHPFHDNQIEVVKKTLVEIGAGNIPTILVLNKIDQLKNEDGLVDLENLRGNYRQHGFDQVIFISATKRENMVAFRQMIFKEVRKKHLMIYPNYVGQASSY